MEVERREIPLSEISCASGSDGLPIAIPASSSHKTAKGKPPNPPLPISCAVCTNFSYLGTNAYATVKTCKVCGKVSKEKKVFEKKDPTRCPHVNTSRLGLQGPGGSEELLVEGSCGYLSDLSFDGPVAMAVERVFSRHVVLCGGRDTSSSCD